MEFPPSIHTGYPLVFGADSLATGAASMEEGFVSRQNSQIYSHSIMRCVLLHDLGLGGISVWVGEIVSQRGSFVAFSILVGWGTPLPCSPCQWFRGEFALGSGLISGIILYFVACQSISLRLQYLLSLDFGVFIGISATFLGNYRRIHHEYT